jgi:hypothetical protein
MQDHSSPAVSGSDRPAAQAKGPGEISSISLCLSAYANLNPDGGSIR